MKSAQLIIMLFPLSHSHQNEQSALRAASNVLANAGTSEPGCPTPGPPPTLQSRAARYPEASTRPDICRAASERLVQPALASRFSNTTARGLRSRRESAGVESLRRVRL